MYRELHSLRQALHHELEDTLPPLPGVEPNKLLQTYLDHLTCTSAWTWLIRPSHCSHQRQQGRVGVSPRLFQHAQRLCVDRRVVGAAAPPA